VFNKDLSSFSEVSDKVTISTISEAIISNDEEVTKYFSKVSINNSVFDFLNLSNFVDGLYINIPANVIIEKPFQIININGGTVEKSFSS